MIRRTLPLLAVAALIGCSDGASEKTTGAGADDATSTTASKAVRFSACMRDKGVADFPDPDASGELTIDAVANDARVDTGTATFEAALRDCKDLQPPGFTGRKATSKEMEYRLRFAQCMRDNGIEDFPDPLKDGPLIDTTRIPSARGRGALDIPGFTEATEKCSRTFGDELGLPKR